LEALARRLGIAQSVDFLGWVPNVGKYLHRAAIVLATTPVEAFGLAVVEAMSAGVPVVAVDAGAHRETLGLVAGAALYPVADLDGGASLLRGLAADHDRRRELGQAERKTQ